jgi:predicted Zn-dependent protease
MTVELRRAVGLVLCAGVVGAAGAAAAETKTHKEAGITIWVPDTWKSTSKADVLTIMDVKEEVAVTFVVLPADSMKVALAKLDEELAKFVTDIDTKGAKPKEKKINGMDAVLLDAVGKVGGKPVDIGVIILKTPTGKALFVLGIIEHDKLAEHSAMLKEVFNSLKPIK